MKIPAQKRMAVARNALGVATAIVGVTAHREDCHARSPQRRAPTTWPS
jgi:hypothetical protein